MTRSESTSLPDSPHGQKHPADGDDRISDLPDSILDRIVSLLPTKNVVANSILSKRWKFLWTTATSLDFYCPKNYTGAVERFVQFVNHVLILQKPGYLNRFSLTWETGCIPFYVNTWISAAVARDVSELFVSVRISNLPTQTKTRMFRCESLQSLELNCKVCISPEIVFSLPRLERLKLISVYFRNEEAFRKLLDGCPVLKYLVIHMDIGKMIRCGYTVHFICIISSPSLRHLELYAYDKRPTTEGESASCGGVHLDAPSLRYIKLKDRINSIVVQERLNFLGEANIQLTPLEYGTEIPDYCNALHAFGCAKTLILSGEVTRAISCGTFKMTTRFNRLTRLEVSIFWKYLSSLQDLIELSDNLEVLIIEEKGDSDDVEDSEDDSEDEDDFEDDSDDDSEDDSDDDSEDNSEVEDDNTRDNNLNYSHWKKPNIVPRCLSNTLKTFSLGDFCGRSEEFEMVSYMLEHGSVLQVVQISFDELFIDSETKVMLIQEISKFPRKSSICEVEFR